MGLFHQLWHNHPTGKFPCSTNGQSHFENQCAIRMGVAFTKSGIDIKRWGLRHCWHHEKGAGHALGAEEMAKALNRVLISGMKRVEKHSGEEGFTRIKRRTGIVFIKDFWGTPQVGDHIDLWNGWHLSSIWSLASLYTNWGSRYDKGRIWFWELG